MCEETCELASAASESQSISFARPSVVLIRKPTPERPAKGPTVSCFVLLCHCCSIAGMLCTAHLGLTLYSLPSLAPGICSASLFWVSFPTCKMAGSVLNLLGVIRFTVAMGPMAQLAGSLCIVPCLVLAAMQYGVSSGTQKVPAGVWGGH